MAWNWLYGMLGMPLREGEGPTRPAAPKAEPRRLRPLAGPAPDRVAGPETQADRLARLRDKHGFGVVNRAAAGPSADAGAEEFDRRMAEARRRPHPEGGAGHHVERATPAPSFVIDYVDYHDVRSRRRITIQKLTVDVDEWDNRIGMIEAWCHLREDVRHFRIDRIRAIVDDDGVVHDDAVRYLAAAVGIDLAAELGLNTTRGRR